MFIFTLHVFSGFSLGSSVEAHTKGIWIWPRPHPRHNDRFLLLIDTEGIGDADKVSAKRHVLSGNKHVLNGNKHRFISWLLSKLAF